MFKFTQICVRKINTFYYRGINVDDLNQNPKLNGLLLYIKLMGTSKNFLIISENLSYPCSPR